MNRLVKFVGSPDALLLLLLMAPCALMAQEERKYIRKGTAEYEKGKFLESEIEYRRALDKDAKSFEGNFNLGNALFKQQKVDESLEQYQNLAGTVTDKEQLSRIYHNIGNAHFAKQEYDKSIAAYKNALKNNPMDNETRYNLIVAQKMQQQQQNQDKKDQDKQDQKQDQKKDQEKQQQQQDQKEQQQNQQQQQQQQQNMSQKDAERLLNAIQQDENKLQEKMKKAKAAQKSAVEKNW